MGGIGEWAHWRARLSGDHVAFVEGERNYTYAEFNERTDRLANALRVEHGVRTGDRLAAVVPTSVACLEMLFAAAKLGAIFTPINVRLTPHEMGYVLSDLGASVLFAHPAFPGAVDALTEPGVTVRSVIEMGEQYEQLVQSGSPETFEPLARDGDVAVVMYTSGTTGRPKGAMITHENLRANAEAVVSAFGVRSSDVTVTALPMFHIGGLGLYTLPFIYVGGRNVIMPSFDPTAVLDKIVSERATQVLLVPTMWQAVMTVENLRDYDLSSLDCALTSGAPTPVAVLDFFSDLGVPVREGFGMTECAPSISLLDSTYIRSKAGSIGRPLFGIDTRIVDESGRDVPQGEVGELLVRAANVFIGYWMLPGATAEVLRDGWFHTGDMACADDEGFLTLVDRKKDMLISGGENVYSREVEVVISEITGVVNVAVVGAPHERWGETPVAFVATAPGVDLTEDQVVAYARERLAKFKVPTSVEFVESLPMTATGKIQKNVLRDRVAQ